MIESMTRAVAAADPGQKGVFFLMTEIRETQLFEFTDFTVKPAVEKPMKARRDWLDDVWLTHNILCMGLEDVHALPGDGNAGMFDFGEDKGYLAGLCDANYIPVLLVRPQVWQAHHRLRGKQGPLGCSPSQESRARKKAHQKKAQALFAEHKVTIENADGMLLCDYIWSIYFGETI